MHSSTTFGTPIAGGSSMARAGALQNRLGQTYATLDSQFRAFLKNGEERLPGNQAAVAQPIPNEAIRTVPRQ